MSSNGKAQQPGRLRDPSLLIGLGVAAALFGACASSTPPSKQVGGDGVKEVAAGADKSRCDYEGRSDRVAIVTQGPAADYPNIRRVYAVGTDRQDGQRVLRCREVDTNLDGINDLIRTYNERGEPLGEQADSDYDGRIDTWLSFARNQVVKAEFDRNGDGQPDEFKVYSQGQLTRVRKDSTYDGLLDTWQVYENGRLNRIGIDLNGDEKVDRWYRDEAVRLEELKKEKAEAEAAQRAQAGTDASAESQAAEKQAAKKQAAEKKEQAPAN